MPERGSMTPVMYRVRERIAEFGDGGDTVTLVIEPIGDAIAPPAPGQFTMLWAFGVGEAPISVARRDGPVIVHTIRAVGAVTQALCGLEAGDQVGVRGPFGSCWPIGPAAGDDVLVVAGGLGVAPVRPIIDHVLAARADYGRCTFFVGARSPEQVLYRDELAALADDGRIDVDVIVDAAGPGWSGPVGLITKLIANATLDAPRTHAFLCGPEPMMRFGALAVLDHGVPEQQVWLSLERNMHCAVVQCGHCQLGPLFLCKDGPVVSWPTVEPLLGIAER